MVKSVGAGADVDGEGKCEEGARVRLGNLAPALGGDGEGEMS